VRRLGRTARILLQGVLILSSPALALNNYIGILGPFGGLSLDSNPDSSGKSYYVGGRFESTTISGQLSVVINSMVGLGIGFPDETDTLEVSDATLSAYLYVGSILRYEATLMRFFSDQEDENASGLYLDVGGGFYYGAALNFAIDGQRVPLPDSALSSARHSVQVIDPVLNAEIKLLLDFDRHFGIYPFLSYEFIPYRSYFRASYTDHHMKHRFFGGVGFAFEW
jgi:hypothetical protein